MPYDVEHIKQVRVQYVTPEFNHAVVDKVILTPAYFNNDRISREMTQVFCSRGENLAKNDIVILRKC